MENKNILNVNSELAIMKNYIADIDYCTSKVNEVGDSALLYQTILKINALTILVTIYVLLCAIFRLNLPLIVIGIALVFVNFLFRKRDQSKRYIISCILISAIIATSILFFMFLGGFIPILVLLVEWIYMIINNFILRNQVWKISRGLE